MLFKIKYASTNMFTVQFVLSINNLVFDHFFAYNSRYCNGWKWDFIFRKNIRNLLRNIRQNHTTNLQLAIPSSLCELNFFTFAFFLNSRLYFNRQRFIADRFLTIRLEQSLYICHIFVRILALETEGKGLIVRL